MDKNTKKVSSSALSLKLLGDMIYFKTVIKKSVKSAHINPTKKNKNITIQSNSKKSKPQKWL